MKQLIYKDWLLSRKTTFIASIYCTIIAVIFLLIRISANCGNIAGNEELFVSLQRNMYILRYTPCIMFFVVLADNGSVIKDYNCGWMRMCRTTAVSERTIVISKLLYSVIVISAAAVPVMIYTAALCIADGSVITWGMIRNISAIYFFSLGISFLTTILSLVFRKTTTVQLVIFSVISVIGIVFSTSMIIKLDKLSEKQDIDLFDFLRTEYGEPLRNALPVMIVFAAAAGAICYCISVQILKRREMP